jgi:hypothetical protein
MRSLHFETPQHKVLECETLVRSMQNLKQQGTKRPRCPKFLFIGTKPFMKTTTRGDTTYEQHDVILKFEHLRL